MPALFPSSATRSRCFSHVKWNINAPPQAATFFLYIFWPLFWAAARAEVTLSRAKNWSLKTACRPRRRPVKLKSRQNLVPKASLPAAPAAQRNTRSVEILSLKHFPGGPGRPNLCQQNQNWRLRRKMRALARQIYTKSFLRTRCALRPFLFKKFVRSDWLFCPFLVFGAASGWKIWRFAPVFHHHRNPSTNKRFKKKFAFRHLRAPRPHVTESYQKIHWKKSAIVSPFTMSSKSLISGNPPLAPPTLKFRRKNFQDATKTIPTICYPDIHILLTYYISISKHRHPGPHAAAHLRSRRGTLSLISSAMIPGRKEKKRQQGTETKQQLEKHTRAGATKTQQKLRCGREPGRNGCGRKTTLNRKAAWDELHQKNIDSTWEKKHRKNGMVTTCKNACKNGRTLKKPCCSNYWKKGQRDSMAEHAWGRVA